MALLNLKIKNFLLIENLNIELVKGFSVFTGETGAGKSMIIGGIAYLLGERVDWELFEDSKKEVEIEGIFSCPIAVKEKLKEIGIPFDDEVYIKRILEPFKKTSRSILNGIMIPLSLLKEITKNLIDIHGQHEHQNLLNEKTHIDFLDGFGNIISLRKEFAEKFKEYKENETLLNKEENTLQKLKDAQDYMRFQLDEMDKLALKIGEDVELENHLQLLRESEKIEQSFSYITDALYGDEYSISSNISKVLRVFSEIKSLNEPLKNAFEILKESEIRINEAYRIIREEKDKFYFDPELYKEQEARLSEINRLKKKHKTDMKGLIELREKLKKDIDDIEKKEENIKNLRETVKKQYKEIKERAVKLSEQRKKLARRFEKAVVKEIKPLGFSFVDFRVEINSKSLDEKGIDDVRFLISTNKNIKPLPLIKIASGGELSRIMLGLKSLLAGVDNVSGMIFDEIDVGIGGRVAKEVGMKMKKIGKERQVLCVTHLPQIAVFADEHFKVDKEEKNERVRIVVESIKQNERIKEIARMLAGEKITKSSVEHAKNLIEEANK